MISQELKDQIDDLAIDIAVLETGKERRQEINAELTKYAERIEDLKERLDNQHYLRVSREAADKLVIESKDLELTQLKEISERMARILSSVHDYRNLDEIDPKAERVLTAYAEWCKQNLK